MPKYVEKDPAVAEAKKKVSFALSANSRELLRTYNEVLKIINNLPTVDIPDIVYCKECKQHGHCLVESFFEDSAVKNGYCAAGTRRKTT